MSSHIYLYPENETQQRLRLSMGLTDIHYEAGFMRVIEPFGVSIEEAEEKIVSGSDQELIVRPPIPQEEVLRFGSALVEFAYSKGRQGTQDIGFIDRTGENETVYWPGQIAAIKRNLYKVK